MATFVKPRPLAWCFFIAAFATTLGLGTWQVKRLQWKEGLIAEIEAAKQQAPLTELPQDAASLEAQNFYPVRISGTWAAEEVYEHYMDMNGNSSSGSSWEMLQEFHISPRFFRGTLGYFIVSPLKLDDGRTLLVNRGWVPARLKNPASRPETIIDGPHRVTIDGILRTGNERNRLTPKSNPAKNIWFGRDIAEMADSANLPKPVPAMVDIVGTQDAAQLPVPSDGIIRLRNDHLSYIITWYGIAAGILTIFALYHRKK